MIGWTPIRSVVAPDVALRGPGRTSRSALRQTATWESARRADIRSPLGRKPTSAAPLRSRTFSGRPLAALLVLNAAQEAAACEARVQGRVHVTIGGRGPGDFADQAAVRNDAVDHRLATRGG